MMRLELEGIGASLQSEDGYTVVQQIIPGGAADKDGRLKPKDKIVGVGQGADGEIVDVVDMKLSDVVKLIRGKARHRRPAPGRAPADSGEAEDHQHHPGEDRAEGQEAQGEVFDEGHKPDGKPYKIGVIDLPSFYMDMEGDRRGAARLQEHHPRRPSMLDEFNAKRASTP